MRIDFTDIYGKRVRSTVPVTMYIGSPESDDRQTLPAGKVSPLIDSYIERSGAIFLQVIPDAGNIPRYIQLTDKIEIVEPDAKDESSLIDRVSLGVSDWWNNTATDAERYSGYLGEGFKKSVADLKVDAFALSKEIKFWLIIAAILYAITLISKFKN